MDSLILIEEWLSTEIYHRPEIQKGPVNESEVQYNTDKPKTFKPNLLINPEIFQVQNFFILIFAICKLKLFLNRRKTVLEIWFIRVILYLYAHFCSKK